MPAKPPEKNAAGLSWGSGPYVRKNERPLWNALYEEFVEELQTLQEFPANVKLSDEQRSTVAWNLTYRTIWHLRDEN